MGHYANADHFYGMPLPEDNSQTVWEAWDNLGIHKLLSKYNLKFYVDGCHVAGEENIGYIGKFDTRVDQFSSRKIKKPPSVSELGIVDANIKAFCKEVNIKHKTPGWWLIAHYG